MGEKLKNFWNRIGNTVMIVPRVWGTVLQSWVDTFETIVALPKDALDVASNTAHNIKDVFVNSWTKWKWYQRMWNIILSPIVATWTAIEWAVRTAITPVVNGVSNGRNTLKNTVKNGRRSTFGRVFSKKPISDFSYDKLNTANIINKDKNRFSNLQFGKKKWNWSNYSTWSNTKWWDANIVGWTATITAANIVSKHELSTLKYDFENKITEMQNKFSSQINDVLSANTKLINENQSLQNDNIELKRKINELKIENKDLKDKTKLEEPSKTEMKKNAKAEGKTKSSTKTDNINDNEQKVNSDKKIENKDNGKSDENQWIEIKEAAREWNLYLNEIVSNNDILNWICNSAIRRYWDSIEFIIDSSTDNSKLKSHKKWEWNIQIIVWSKMNQNLKTCAPMNWNSKAPAFREKQIKHNLAHELSHIALQLNNDKWEKLVNIMKKFADNWCHLSTISQNTKKYTDNESRATEDACELFALYCNSKEDFDKYMKILSENTHAGKREKLWVTKISNKDFDDIKNACKILADEFISHNDERENGYQMAA